jgi:lactoylglutathione lyase
MPRHFDAAPGLCEDPDHECQRFVFNQALLRIRDPERSLDFYTRVMGMRLLRRLELPEERCSLYFLAMASDDRCRQIPLDAEPRTTWVLRQPGVLGLTHPWDGLPDAADDGHAGSSGLGHIGFSVPDVYLACQRFENFGVAIAKQPDRGRPLGLALIQDPDRHWIEIRQPDMLERQAQGKAIR